MKNSLKFFLNLTMIQAVNSRKFDARLSAHGINLSNFMILYHLYEAPDNMLRRTDLSEKTGLTASGITRMLKPMEKIGLVTRKSDARDARVSYVKLSSGGERILKEATTSAEMAAEELFSDIPEAKLEDLSQALIKLGGKVT